MYHRMGYGPVLEIIANWDNKPTFTKETIHPDSSLDHLLDSPRQAFKEMFGDCRRRPGTSEVEWRNHVFSQKCVIAEICAWTSQHSYLDILAQI